MSRLRADVVGSLLRPDYLMHAREQHAAGRLGAADFKRIEDRAVDEAIVLQENAGLDVITDGEMRRDVFASQLVQASEGFEHLSGNWVDWFDMRGERHTLELTTCVVGKIRRKRHLSSEEFSYLRGRASRPVKVTLPSPSMYAFYWTPGVSEAAYPSLEAYLADVADILHDEVAELARLGAEYIQFDAPEFGVLLDTHQREWFARKGWEPDRLIREGVEMINAITAGHPSLTFGLHVCRGNHASRYMASGGYGRIAGLVLAAARVQRLLLEYDDERSGDFAPLANVPDDKVIVLGLVTTKTPREESADELRARIREASQYIPLERLALSTQCGFASVAPGNAISPEAQAKKLRLVADVARQVWPD